MVVEKGRQVGFSAFTQEPIYAEELMLVFRSSINWKSKFSQSGLTSEFIPAKTELVAAKEVVEEKEWRSFDDEAERRI